MTYDVPQEDRDSLLRLLLSKPAIRRITRRWGESQSPYSDLRRDCIKLAEDRDQMQKICEYLVKKPLILLTMKTFLAHYCVAAFVRWDQIPMPAQLFAKRGIWIARWLPTFLVIDAPLGEILRSNESPVRVLLRDHSASYPTLVQARDLFDNDLFRRVRNGLAHWCFVFENEGTTEERLVCFDRETRDRTVVTIHEAEALHYASYLVVECLDKYIFRYCARPH